MLDMKRAVYFTAMSPIQNLGMIASTNRRMVENRPSHELSRNVFGSTLVTRDPQADHSKRHREITANASRHQPSLFFLNGMKDTLKDINILTDKMERKFNTNVNGEDNPSIP